MNDKQLKILETLCNQFKERNIDFFLGKIGKLESQGLSKEEFMSIAQDEDWLSEDYILIMKDIFKLQNGLLSEEDIRGYCSGGWINENILQQHSSYSQDKIKDLCGLKADPIPVPSDLWKEYHPLMNKATDIFIVGAPRAGKSVLLTGLFGYSTKIGKLNQKPEIRNGSIYSSILINSAETGRFIIPTPPNEILHTACDFEFETDQNTIICPLNLTEVSGEIFRAMWDEQDIRNLLEGSLAEENEEQTGLNKLVKYLFESNNKKIFIFSVPYGEFNIEVNVYGDNINTIMEQFYILLLQDLESKGLLNNSVGLALTINKWDKSDDDSISAFERYIEDNFYNLWERMLKYKNKYNLNIGKFPVSIGIVDEDRSTFDFKPENFESIYKWITDTAGKIRIDRNIKYKKKKWYEFILVLIRKISRIFING